MTTVAWHEKDCRDTLLSHLRPALQQYGVDAEPEGSYKEDRRADIRVSRAGFNVPIEIKKDTHRDVWRAAQGQLAAYAQDPGAEGHGVYVVLWFGFKDCQRDPDGTRLESSEDMEKRLRDRLPDEISSRTRIVVLDVSAPGADDG